MQIQGFETASFCVNSVRIHFEKGGQGEPLLLLHGYPQTHLIWHQVAPELAKNFTVICPDLRGYGDSEKPTSDAEHLPYSKRVMAADMVALMAELGFEGFVVAGHDRGARVAHRMAQDHPEVVQKLCVMDIAPTLHMFDQTDQAFATGYYHWFFLIQPGGLPEKMIGDDPGWYLKEKLKCWGGRDACFYQAAVEEYVRCFSDPAAIHASCEDYRAAATVDLEHDRADRDRKLECPLLVLWGSQGFVARSYPVLDVWRDYAEQVSGTALDCGHFLPEEQPGPVIDHLLTFLES